MEKKEKKQVLVAMSGGVDSSVSAHLLKKQGYNVTGVFLRLWREDAKFNEYLTKINERSVRNVAKKLNIPLKIIDLRKDFKKKVVDYFLREYKTGKTPNPCVVCNREIKFKFLFNELLKLKADYVATGHYARLRREFPISNFQFPIKSQISKSKKIIYKLYTAKDKTKDQSYFLYTLKQKQLAKILFPLGNYKKEEVKKIARNLKLPVNMEESQSVCFIAGKCPDEFLKKNMRMRSGNIVDINGSIIGRHQGLPLYTIGQRRNIRIGGTGPYYAAAKDFKKNLLIVANRPNDPLLFSKSLIVKNANWLNGKPKFPLKAGVCIRYHHPPIRAIINIRNTKYEILFTKPQRAVTPGQSAVFYSKKGEVLGGGVINH